MLWPSRSSTTRWRLTFRQGDFASGLDAAIAAGPGIINLSLGSAVRNSLVESMVTVAVGSGSLVVAAAGNSRTNGSPLEYPASLPNVLTAGALDQSGQPAYFSSGSPLKPDSARDQAT
jgi:subtilisin family serine protease